MRPSYGEAICVLSIRNCESGLNLGALKAPLFL